MTSEGNVIGPKRLALCRIAGYLVQAKLLLEPLISAGKKMEDVLPYHPELQPNHDMGPRFATLWNVSLHLIYILYGLSCDLLLLLNLDWCIPSAIRNYRYTFFCALVGPFTWFIVIIFWPIYIYDRELVFPTRADLVLTFSDNIKLHALIGVFVLWEVSHLPKESVKGSPVCVKHIWIFNALYTIVGLQARFFAVGVWPYDIVTITEFNFVHYFILMLPYTTSFLGYYVQFRFKDLVWNLRERGNKSIDDEKTQ